MARVEITPDIDPRDPSTWISPVDVTHKIHAMTKAHVYRAEYTIPSTPNAILMAILQLPKDVPRNLPAYPRHFSDTKWYDTKANPRRDGRNKGGFAFEVTWPGVDLFHDLEAELDRLDHEVHFDED